MHVTEETKALAQKIQDYFILYPERHRQDEWVAVEGATSCLVTDENICNTTMCVAGTAVFLNGGMQAMNDCQAFYGSSFSETAQELLGLTYEEADRLFYCMDNQAAKDAVAAIAAGDEKKFDAILTAAEEE